MQTRKILLHPKGCATTNKTQINESSPCIFPIFLFINESSFFLKLSLPSPSMSWQQGVLTKVSEGVDQHFLPELNAGNQSHKQEV